jgi:serine/threonine protein kinase
VLDFGLAKITVPDVKESDSATLTLTDTGIAMGTLLYMSPEQLQGRSANACSQGRRRRTVHCMRILRTPYLQGFTQSC